jgi:hypothetical protein
MRRNLNWILCSAWKNLIGGTSLEHPPSSQDLATCDFWALTTMKRELRGKKFRNDQRSAARFRWVCGALYEVHRLPKEVLRKRDRHRTSTNFQLRVIRLSLRTFQTTLLCVCAEDKAIVSHWNYSILKAIGYGRSKEVYDPISKQLWDTFSGWPLASRMNQSLSPLSTQGFFACLQQRKQLFSHHRM